MTDDNTLDLTTTPPDPTTEELIHWLTTSGGTLQERTMKWAAARRLRTLSAADAGVPKPVNEGTATRTE